MRKILPYLLINFLVSAAAVVIVLLIWESTHKTPKLTPQPYPPALQAELTPWATLPARDKPTIEIQVVVGAGDLSNERVQLVCASEEPIDLLGWVLSDGESNEFTFPEVRVYPGGSIYLYTRAGANSSVELFWGKANPVWSSQARILLKDHAGNLRSEYQVP
jgi:hypothetical protein